MLQQIINGVLTGLVMAPIVGIMSYFISKRAIGSSIDMVSELIDKYLPVGKQLTSMLGERSGEARQLKKAENMVMNDVLNSQLPELQVFRSMLSGETLEYLEENPHVLMALYQKYEPMISDLLKKKLGKGNRPTQDYHV